MREPRLILFDLGGVLFELHDPYATFGLDAGKDDFHERWLMSPSVREFERGALDNDSFAAAIVVEAGLNYDGQEFLRRFDAWPKRFFPGALNLVEQLARRFGVALLSNTNAMHWERADIGDLLATRMSRTYLSYETGKIKPEKDAFEQVIEEQGCDPAEILFLDDNHLNVDGARRLGMRAERVIGINAVQAALDRHGIDTGINA